MLCWHRTCPSSQNNLKGYHILIYSKILHRSPFHQRSFIPHICHFFTQAKFLENKIYTEKRVNYDKLHSKLPILRVNHDKLYSKLPIFCVKSVKIYTGQKKLTRAPPVAPVTNMRYDAKKNNMPFAVRKTSLSQCESFHTMSSKRRKGEAFFCTFTFFIF